MSHPTSKLPNLTRITQDFADMLEARGGKPLYELTPDDAREFLLNLQRETHKNIEADFQDINVVHKDKNISVRIVRPKGNEEKLPVILYLHGGGWILGNKETHDMLIKKLAGCTNSAVVFPEFTPSPEAQYPQAVNEAFTVLEYIKANAKELNLNAEKITVAGDSAGGNMAIALAMKSLRENGPKIIFMTLFYPVTNADMDTESYNDFADGPWLTKKAMEWFFEAYEPDEEKRKNDNNISVIKASFDELKDLPPALIITAENDVLRDEGEAFARKLDEAGVEVMNVRINGTHHDFMMLNALFDTAPTHAGFKLACSVLNYVFQK